LHEIAGSAAIAYTYAVRLHQGPDAIASFESAVAHLRGGSDLHVSDLDGSYVLIERSIHLQAVSWWILAGVAGAAG